MRLAALVGTSNAEMMPSDVGAPAEEEATAPCFVVFSVENSDLSSMK